MEKCPRCNNSVRNEELKKCKICGFELQENKTLVDIKEVEKMVFRDEEYAIRDEELEIAKEILNVFSKNRICISSAIDILEFCEEALKYNPVHEFI